MRGLLLDTNILSELRRPRPEPKVVAFISAQPLESLYVSAVTLAEIRFGIERIDDLQKRASLTDWLQLQLRPMFGNRALAVSEDVLFKWRLLVEAGRKIGHTFPQPDLFIAATALHHGLAVVTRDLAGFDKTGVELINPWARAFNQT